MTRATRNLVIGAAVVFVGALAVGALAFAQLDASGRDSFYGDVAKLSYQAAAIVVLGALVTKALANARDDHIRAEGKAAEKAELARLKTQLRTGFIQRLVDTSHNVDVARMHIRAHRSVKTWTEQMDKIVASYVDLRDIKHQVTTAHEAGDPVFAQWEDIRERIDDMVEYLNDLIDEFGDNKKRLEDVQIAAEQDRTRQGEVWDDLLSLPELSTLLRDDKEYDRRFRRPYRKGLAEMRKQLTDRTTQDV